MSKPSEETSVQKTNSITKCHVMCPSTDLSAEDRKQHSPFCLAPPGRASKRRQPVRGNSMRSRFHQMDKPGRWIWALGAVAGQSDICLLYTSDAADDWLVV